MSGYKVSVAAVCAPDYGVVLEVIVAQACVFCEGESKIDSPFCFW